MPWWGVGAHGRPPPPWLHRHLLARPAHGRSGQSLIRSPRGWSAKEHSIGTGALRYLYQARAGLGQGPPQHTTHRCPPALRTPAAVQARPCPEVQAWSRPPATQRCRHGAGTEQASCHPEVCSQVAWQQLTSPALRPGFSLSLFTDKASPGGQPPGCETPVPTGTFQVEIGDPCPHTRLPQEAAARAGSRGGAGKRSGDWDHPGNSSRQLHP